MSNEGVGRTGGGGNGGGRRGTGVWTGGTGGRTDG